MDGTVKQSPAEDFFTHSKGIFVKFLFEHRKERSAVTLLCTPDQLRRCITSVLISLLEKSKTLYQILLYGVTISRFFIFQKPPA